MKPLGLGISLVLLLFSALSSSGFAQNIEAGLHAGFASLGDETPLGQENGGEFGVWLQLWPTDGLAISADWAYVPREDFTDSIGGFPVGETDRNRQYVDVTLQRHFEFLDRFSFFAEIGGGKHWDNRQVENPFEISEFEESGKESTSHVVWTVGGGGRLRLSDHFNWIGQLKFHNLGSDRNGTRLITGITISWR